ncbi:MAG TPA: hypothetical protein VL307_03445 [Chitinophagaceae bacterium]|nr:hypothetical protein [Chitinophagaceae bacterium]
MSPTKIQLSKEELQLVKDPSWILTKHRIIEKVYQLFGSLSDKMQAEVLKHAGSLPPEILSLPPKISKGEQYEALPYVVLDYPRLFSKEDVFAVRSFFWWGNYFSITLHLKGKYLQQYGNALSEFLPTAAWKTYFVSSTGNEFSFNLQQHHYQPVTGLTATFYDALPVQPFLKLSYKIPFDQWMEAEEKLFSAFKAFLSLASH